MTNQQLAIQFFLQLAAILVACRLMGRVMAAVGQPRVIGEMLAGVLLGPSLFGWLAPSLQASLFPAASLSVMSVVSQVGLVLYMFVVGTHLSTDFVKQAYKSAMLISLAGVAVPFVLGALLAYFLLADGRFFGAGITGWQSMVYVAAAMSVTAFPVLARIIQDRGISGTALGTLTLTAGAAGDAIAWCLLAIVLSSLTGAPGIAVAAIGGGAAYGLIVFTIVRPRLVALAADVEREGSLTTSRLTLLVGLLMAGAWFTERIGVHAVFGAFVLGAAMPRGTMTADFGRQVEPLTTVLLVPLFFAYSGLSTHAGLLWSAELLWLAAGVTLIASVGKVVACWAAARLIGRPHHEALAIGALMNARGLMELIILNIGLERGLITPTLFTIMVMMTLITTMAAGPLFEWAWRSAREVPDLAGVRAH